MNPTVYPPSTLSTLKFNITFVSESIVRIKITDPNKQRYEVPIQPLSSVDPNPDKKYSVHVNKMGFGVIISRNHNNAVVFNSSIAPMLYGDQFLQV